MARPGKNSAANAARPKILYILRLVKNPMHTLRRLHFSFIALVAVLCLLGMQQGAAIHGLTHLADENSAGPQKHLPHAKSCEKCIVYAEVSGTGPTTVHPALQVPSQIVVVTLSAHKLVSPRTLPAYSARAPPFSV